MNLSSSQQDFRAVQGMGKVEAVIAFGVAVLLLWLWSPFARIGVDVHHDGIMLKPALDVLSGQVLFRDSFSQYGALTVYLHALGLWFHPALFTLKFMSLCAVVASLFIFYGCWRELMPRSLAIAGAGMFVAYLSFFDPDWLLLPWSSDFAMLFQAITLYSLLQVIRGNHAVRWAGVTGVACAATFWCRQPVGLLLILATAVILVSSWWAGWSLSGQAKIKVLMVLILGLFGVNALMFAGLAGSGALLPWWEQNIIWPQRWAARGWTSDPLVFDYLKKSFHPKPLLAFGLGLALLIWPWLSAKARGKFWPPLWSIIYYGGLGIASVVGWMQWREWFIVPHAVWDGVILALVAGFAFLSFFKAILCRIRGGDAPATEFFLCAALAGVCLASLAQIYPLPCQRHIFWAYAPAFGLVGYALWRLSGLMPLVLSLALGFLLLPGLKDRMGWGGYTLQQPLETLSVPLLLSGMRVSPEEAHFFRDYDGILARVEKARPDTPLTVFGGDALLLCFARNLENPGPFYVNWADLLSPEEDLSRWAYILARRPVIIFHNYGTENLERFIIKMNYAQVWSMEAARVHIFAPSEWADQIAPTGMPQDYQNPVSATQ